LVLEVASMDASSDFGVSYVRVQETVTLSNA
jgi:hypothetical protein